MNQNELEGLLRRARNAMSRAGDNTARAAQGDSAYFITQCEKAILDLQEAVAQCPRTHAEADGGS